MGICAIICIGLVAVIGANRYFMHMEKLEEDLVYFEDFTLPGYDGGADLTNEDFSDYKLIVINGWAPWCPSCVNEMPEFEEIAKDYADKGVLLVGVVADYYTAVHTRDHYDQSIADVLNNLGVTYPIYLTDEVFNDEVASTMQFFPTTWAVDSTGKIVEIVVGSASGDTWRENIDRWLSEVEG